MYDADQIDRGEYLEMRRRNRDAIEQLERVVETTAGAPPVHLVGAADDILVAWDYWTFEERRDFLTTVVDHVEILPYRGGPRNRFDPAA